MNGIDYGMGQTNIDTKTGIRYGVIHQNEVLEAWIDCAEADYGKPHCPHCGNELDETLLTNSRFNCPHCQHELNDWEVWAEEPLYHYVNDSEYKAESTSNGDLFITKSPYYTKCEFCSPCAPGAGYLVNHHEDGIKAYCFGHDWFEDGKAPYPVYRVSDNTLVTPTE